LDFVLCEAKLGRVGFNGADRGDEVGEVIG
jgi:hypothetical protein